MKSVRVQSVDDLVFLYESKVAKLQKLIENQTKQLAVLDFGKGEISAGLSIANEKIIRSMLELDKKIEKIAESAPGSAAIIEITQAVFDLTAKARKNYELIQEKMEACLQDIKRDLNLVQLKRQLSRHLSRTTAGGFLHETRIWQQKHC